MINEKFRDTINIFAYGTLNEPVRLRGILCMQLDEYNAKIESHPAVLHNYSKHHVVGANYPAIQPSWGNKVNGFLIQGIPKECLEYLDAYEGEGDLYRRKSCTVEVAGSNNKLGVLAQTYVWARGADDLD